MGTMLHGHDLKKAILETIFERFDDWSKPFAFTCKRGCAYCCTQNVTLTAVEAQILLDYVVSENMQGWLIANLENGFPTHRAAMTTNRFAELCLKGKEPSIENGNYGSTCPFLENDRCMVYPVRPYACRCFASTVVCRRGGSAAVPPEYLSAATAVSQIIEHLGQFNIWGNMLPVLYVLGHETGVIDSGRDVKTLAAARDCCTTAQPLPGFLLDESESTRIVPLIESIFAANVDGRNVEDILNNR